MNTNFSELIKRIAICALLLQACSLTQLPSIEGEPTVGDPNEAPTRYPTATLQLTFEPTATVWPPVFNGLALEDIRKLDSFIVIVNEKNTVNGSLTELTNTIGFIKEPYGAYGENKYSTGLDRTYVLNGWTFTATGSGDWYISAGSNDDVFYKAQIPYGNTGSLLDAQFAGQEDYQGIPAYHFVLEPVKTTAGNTTSQLEGDLYVAQEGNYVLYSHWKQTTAQGNFTQVYEVTHAMSSINQLTAIQLPADMTPMVAAINLPAEMGMPVPGVSVVDRMIRYKHGIGVDLYFFTDSRVSQQEFFDFYRNLPPTNGWQVTHIGHVSLHTDDCEFKHECVILKKGNTQVILHYMAGSIRAEFDWPHLYSPL